MVRRSNDDGLDERDRTLLEKLEEWGWFVIKVGAGRSEPAFAYSMGLYQTFGHPELIVFGLDFDTMHQLINDVGARIQRGECIRDGQVDENLLDGYRCVFRSVNKRHYDQFLCYAGWYYRGWEFPALQLIWPDMSGKLPWECGFDERYAADQPMLFAASDSSKE